MMVVPFLTSVLQPNFEIRRCDCPCNCFFADVTFVISSPLCLFAVMTGCAFDDVTHSPGYQLWGERFYCKKRSK